MVLVYRYLINICFICNFIQVYFWETYTVGTPIPDNALLVGLDSDGSKIFLGRASHEEDLLPAKVIPDKEIAYVSYNGKEIPKEEIHILLTESKGIVSWESASNGEIPSDALCVGKTCDGEKLYYGRCCYNNSYTPGKVHVSHGCLYIAYNGEEIAVKDYEVLILK